LITNNDHYLRHLNLQPTNRGKMRFHRKKSRLAALCLAFIVLTGLVITQFKLGLLNAKVTSTYVRTILKSEKAEENSVVKDPVESVKQFRKLADQGSASAEFNLGKAYILGEGVEKNNVEAAKWFRRSAEHGHVLSQFHLATAYMLGEGVEKNSVEAVKWCRKSAEQGFAVAQFNLGVSYANGDGVPKNAQTAYGWFLLAKVGGFNAASLQLESLGKILSPSEQQAAESWAQQWTPTN